MKLSTELTRSLMLPVFLFRAAMYHVIPLLLLSRSRRRRSRRSRRRIGVFCIKMAKRDYHHGFIFLNLSSSASTNVPAPPIGLLVRINQQAASSAKIFLHTLKVSSTRPKSYEIVDRPRPFTENQNHKCTKFTKVIFLPLIRLPLRRAVDR